MKRVAYFITESQKEFLLKESARTGLSQCELIRRYIDAARDAYEEKSQEDTCQETE